MSFLEVVFTLIYVMEKNTQVQDANPINPVSFCQGIALVTNQKVQCWKDVAMVQTASQPQEIQRPVVFKMLLPTAVQEHGFCSFGRDVKVKQCQTSKPKRSPTRRPALGPHGPPPSSGWLKQILFLAVKRASILSGPKEHWERRAQKDWMSSMVGTFDVI